jgi:histidinol dehydrogenase
MVLRILISSDHESLEELRKALEWDFWTEKGPLGEVRSILKEVEERGDEALLEFTSRFDGVDLVSKGLRVKRAELEKASSMMKRPFVDAVRAATRAITTFHRHQSWESQFWESDEGARIGQMVRALKRVGAYVPGGSASYPSTAMMTVIPAKVAGVNEIAVCVPPGKDGDIDPSTLYTLYEMGVEEVYRLGGAQAVAALAFGTETISAVDKIVGPGNVYVALAKREVFGRVGIDVLAGPSELALLADAGSGARYLAYDILAQLEHGSGARACLITDSEDLVKRVDKELSSAMGAQRSKQSHNAAAIVVRDIEEGGKLVDILAPEHLVIATDDITGVLSGIHNAGAIFLGGDSPVALGDYAVGVNHVLPTGGAARFSSPLGVYDFIKRSNVVISNPKANRALSQVVEALAEVEGFTYHAESMRKRLH